VLDGVASYLSGVLQSGKEEVGCAVRYDPGIQLSS